MTYDHIGYPHRHFVLNYEGVNKSVREVYQSGFRTFYVLKTQTLGSNLTFSCTTTSKFSDVYLRPFQYQPYPIWERKRAQLAETQRPQWTNMFSCRTNASTELSFEDLKQSQDNLCQCLMNKQNVTENTIDSMTEHCSGDVTAKPVLPVQKSMTPAQVTQEQSNIATNLHIPEKTVIAVQDVEYANLTEFITGNEMAPQYWEAAMVNGQLKMCPKKSPKAINNFGAWLI